MVLQIARNLLVNSDARRSYNIAVQNNDVGLVEVPWSQLPGALALLQVRAPCDRDLSPGSDEFQIKYLWAGIEHGQVGPFLEG